MSIVNIAITICTYQWGYSIEKTKYKLLNKNSFSGNFLKSGEFFLIVYASVLTSCSRKVSQKMYNFTKLKNRYRLKNVTRKCFTNMIAFLPI